MNRPATHRALLDHDDRVLSADARLSALNERAGGRAGGALAIASLLTLVRLSRRLGVPIARPMTIADGDLDGEWYVRAIPAEDRTVAIAAMLLREHPAAAGILNVALTAVLPPPDAQWEWEVDAALRMVRIGAGAAALHGLDAVTVLTAPLSAVFVLEASPDGSMPLIEAMGGVHDFTAQAATLRARGQRVMLAGNVRRDGGGGFAGFVGGTFTDVPDAALSGDFNARLHRVLCEPLGQIIRQADSINAATDGPLTPHYVDYAADIAGAARHLLGLVDDLVDMEAIERADFVTARDRVDLVSVARRAAGLLAAAALEAQVSLSPLEGEASAVAVGEGRRALQIAVNLVDNAIRYSPAGARVVIRTERRDGQVMLIVADHGHGIPERDQARIFEKFARGEASGPGGNGLGLYIARRLAQAMDGTLTVASVEGYGATFTLALPEAW